MQFNLIPLSSMNTTLYQFFTEDHQRIEKLLIKATENPEGIDMSYYHQFRTQLLRHIKMEEKILFPAAKKSNPDLMKVLLPQFRLEHGAITALMVPPPTMSLINVIWYLLEKHDLAEEKPGGLYEVCERLTKDHTQALLIQLCTTKEVPVHPPNPAPIAMESARRAMKRAGYDYDAIIQQIEN